MEKETGGSCVARESTMCDVQLSGIRAVSPLHTVTGFARTKWPRTWMQVPSLLTRASPHLGARHPAEAGQKTRQRRLLRVSAQDRRGHAARRSDVPRRVWGVCRHLAHMPATAWRRSSRGAVNLRDVEGSTN